MQDMPRINEVESVPHLVINVSQICAVVRPWFRYEAGLFSCLIFHEAAKAASFYYLRL